MSSTQRKYPNSSIEAINFLYEQGWTDGLPVIPPTEEAVEWMLTGSDRDRLEVIARMAPANGEATVEAIAANAVMAGCEPEMLPVVIATIEAVTEPQLNLAGRQTTTSPGAPIVIVNGPIARELDINGGFNAFGPGWRANAAIGRALRLCCRNIGGGIPGHTDRSTMGHPGKYTYCIAENEAESPWEPLHVERGLPKESSAVTLLWGEAPHNINDQKSASAEGILRNVASTMSTLGCNLLYRPGEALIVLSPEHAKTIVASGWSKNDVKHFLYNQARQPLSKAKYGGFFGVGELPKWIDLNDDNSTLPIVLSPENLLVAVAGGPGRHSMAMMTPGATASVTKPITLRDGSHARSVTDFTKARQ
jgi:hypothetical protein